MAPRIVYWGDHEIGMSPDLSSAASIVSFDSFSDSGACPGHLQMPPTACEASGLHSADLEVEHNNLLGGTTPGGSFIRHDEYFFKDGNVTFLVGGTLYCVHRHFFSRFSVYFSSRFAKLGIRDHEALPIIISIGDVERDDFEALLSVLYPTNFEAHELTYEQWKSVLHLSTRWDFTSLRKLALKSITPPTPHDQLVLARTYAVDQWVLPALTALCERALPLSLDEAREMSMEDVITVATVREEIRGSAFPSPSRVDAADISRYIEVAQAGKLSRPVCREVYWDEPKSRSTVQESDSTMADPNMETEDTKTILSSGLQHMGTKEGESDVEHSSKEGEAVTVLAENGAEEMARLDAAEKMAAEILQCLEAEEASCAKEKEAAEAREAIAEANAKKREADLKAKANAEAQKRAEANENARKKQEKATRAKAKADAEAKNAAEMKTEKAVEKAMQAAKTAEKAAKRAKKAVDLANVSNK